MDEKKEKWLEFERDMQYVVVVGEIAKALIKYRKEHNLTQSELAEILEVNQAMVAKLESGDYNPTFKKIFYISWKLTNSSEFFVDVLKNINLGIKRHSENSKKELKEM